MKKFFKSKFSHIVCICSILIFALSFQACETKKKTTIRLIHFSDATYQKIFEDIIDKWIEKHPDIKVNIEAIPWNNYTDKILTEYAGGTSADVAWIENSHACILIPKGVLNPLSDLIANDKSIDIKAYWPAIVNRFVIDGKIYCIPSDVAPTACIYYNKRLFDKAGIPYPKDDWDWNKFLETAKKLTITDKSTNIIQYGIYSGWSESWIYSAGGGYVDNVQRPTKCILDDPKSMAGLQFYFDLALKHKVMPLPISVGIGATADMSMDQMFIFQRVAMVQSGIWSAAVYNKSIKDFDWDIALFPKAPGKNIL